MAFELVLSIFAFLAVAALLGILVYQLMCLSDLEFDYINPYDSASRINASVVPEIAIHVGLSCVYLIFGYWFMFLINLPLIYYHACLYLDHKHLVDVTEIFTSLNREKKYRLVKLAFYILLFFLAIYRLVAAAVHLIVDYEAAQERAAEFSGFHSHI
ncbi:unnamed protein product [Sphagnum compactum]